MEDPEDSEIVNEILKQFTKYAHMKQGIFRTFQWVFLPDYIDRFTLSSVHCCLLHILI